jgi:hypothetical protein
VPRARRRNPTPLIHRRGGDRLAPAPSGSTARLERAGTLRVTFVSPRFINTGSPYRTGTVLRARLTAPAEPRAGKRRNPLTKTCARRPRLLIRRISDCSASAANEEFPVTRCGSGVQRQLRRGDPRCAFSKLAFGRSARLNRADRCAHRPAARGYGASPCGTGAGYALAWDGGGSDRHSRAVGDHPMAGRAHQWNDGRGPPQWGRSRCYGGSGSYGRPGVPT